MPLISVIIPTHNPRRDALRRALQGLAAQSLDRRLWETLVVDNASSPPLPAAELETPGLGFRVIREPALGLTYARKRGFAEAKGALCVLVDDDNVLDPAYLAHVLQAFEKDAKLGAVGGAVSPEFEEKPAPWLKEFEPLLALRPPRSESVFASLEQDPETGRIRYPEAAPIGAGMALRREIAMDWSRTRSGLSDRRGNELSSGGDNDIVLHVLRSGWRVGFLAGLHLTHLIPSARLDPRYLARLNRGIQRSWIRVLHHHGACPWPPIPAFTVPFRAARAWFRLRACESPARSIRWRGALGHFEGRADIGKPCKS